MRVPVLCLAVLLAPAAHARTVELDPDPAGHFGYGDEVAGAGDVDGDGYDDVLVADPREGAGRVYLYHGGVLGLDRTPALVLDGPAGTLNYGTSVDAAGDVNGDGYGDVIIGAGGAVGATAGRAYVHLGSALGLSPTPAFTVTSADKTELLGKSVAGAGDVNGDGYDDVVVGTPLHDGAGADRGRVSLYAGSAAGTLTLAWEGFGVADGDQFGDELAAGDFTGDGYSDVAVSAPHVDALLGAVYVFAGSPTGLGAAPLSLVDGVVPGYSFGTELGSAGDLDLDGYDDLLVATGGWRLYDCDVTILNGSATGVVAGQVSGIL